MWSNEVQIVTKYPSRAGIAIAPRGSLITPGETASSPSLLALLLLLLKKIFRFFSFTFWSGKQFLVDPHFHILHYQDSKEQ